jgi:predicted outer membrane protein
MRRVLLVAVIVFAAAAAPAPQQFVEPLLLSQNEEIDLARMAMRRGNHPDVRALAAMLSREQTAMRAALSSFAQQRRMPVPLGVIEKAAALHQNLAILTPDLFDVGYVLGVVQDLNAQLATLSASAKSPDLEQRQFSRSFAPVVARERKVAMALLKDLGGSPFGYPP